MDWTVNISRSRRVGIGPACCYPIIQSVSGGITGLFDAIEAGFIYGEGLLAHWAFRRHVDCSTLRSIPSRPLAVSGRSKHSVSPRPGSEQVPPRSAAIVEIISVDAALAISPAWLPDAVAMARTAKGINGPSKISFHWVLWRVNPASGRKRPPWRSAYRRCGDPGQPRLQDRQGLLSLWSLA
jgi:hypothetical protein